MKNDYYSGSGAYRKYVKDNKKGKFDIYVERIEYLCQWLYDNYDFRNYADGHDVIDVHFLDDAFYDEIVDIFEVKTDEDFEALDDILDLIWSEVEKCLDKDFHFDGITFAQKSHEGVLYEK